MPASGPRYSPSQFNYFKFSSIVLNEFPKALRQTFKTMWNKKFPSQPWDDSVAVRNQLGVQEGHTAKIPTHESYQLWDSTALAAATIFSKTFKVYCPTKMKNVKLHERYLMSLIPPKDSFRSTVTSATGDQDETFSLAIDQLRLLRNATVHSHTDVLDKATFHDYIKYAMMAFTALQYDTRKIDEISKLLESKLPTDIENNVPELEKRIEEEQKKEEERDDQEINNISPNKPKWFKIAIACIVLITIAIIASIYTRPEKEIDSAVPTWMNTSNPVFIGRGWLFKQLEDIFQKNDSPNGVLLVGDPGSGKTTIMRQLVSSRINSSRFIHENIIACHFCQYDKGSTRDGETFVKSLVDQLSGNVPGFKEYIQKKEIQNILNKCKDDPIECAQVTVLEPLNALTIPLETKKFILIDALDECRENDGSYKSVIIKILHGQRIRLPSWIKLLVSARNDGSITRKMSEIEVETIAIRATSKNNLADIRSFAQEMISRHEFKTKNGESMKEKINESIENILRKTDGNFLFIQMLLDNWAKTPDKINLASIPSNMNDVYRLSFRERFEKDELERFAKFFEILLASNWPPTLQILKRILILTNEMNDRVFHDVVDKLHTYLRLDDYGIVRIFHQTFAEWLTNHDEPIDGFSIKKSRGHQYIANYLFEHYNQPENELTVEGLYELSLHVLNGEMLPKYVRKLTDLNSNVTDQFGKCILHYLAQNRESTEVLKVFIKQFKSVDIFDKRGHTPVWHATTEENYHNLELLIENGADVNYVTADNCSYCSYSNSYCQSLTFIAAQKGNKKIVELLVNKGADFEKEDKCGWKPLYIALKKGHLKTVEFLLRKTKIITSSDRYALFQAAAFNHSDVLKSILESGVRDKCIPCKRDYKDYSIFRVLTTHHFLETICGSVLNIAVSRRHLNIVKILLSYGKESLECKSLAGLTPLLQAVEKNDIKMVKLLLDKGADVEAQCETRSIIDERIRNVYLQVIFFSPYYCSCTSKAIHISAIQGTSNITTELIKRNANRFSRDCLGWSADDIAAMHNQHVNTSLLNKTMIHYLAVCGSVKAFELLSRNKSGDILTTVYEDGMTLLHLATLGLTNVFSSVCTMINCTAFRCQNMDAFLKGAHREEQYLKTIKLLTEVAPQNINKKDKHGRTALHYAALVRSPGVVKYLIQKGSNWKIKDEDGNTALKFALKQPINYTNLGSCSAVIYSLLNYSSEMAISNEMYGNCLKMLQFKTLDKCQFTIETIIEVIARHNLPLGWYTLLKIDADLQCLSHEDPRLPMALATTSELLKLFELDVKVNCEVLLAYSTLHAVVGGLSHHIRFGKNFVFSALQRHVDTYSVESSSLDESYTIEGFLPIHCAVLGGNIDAIDFFMNKGVDIWKKTRSGWTILDLSLSYGQCSPQILDKLLSNITNSKEYKVSSDFWCNTTSSPLSLLHIAAINGLRCLRYIHENTFIPISRLPFNSCSNKHGIDLLYLIKLYYDHNVLLRYFPVNITLSKYPKREAEYHIIYNIFFVTPDVNLNLKFDVSVLNLFQHPEINNLLPHGHVIERQIRRCYDRCWHSTSHASRNFFSTFRAVLIIKNKFDPRSEGFIDIVPQMAELRYHCVKMFYNVSNPLWKQVSKAYTCSHKCRCLEIMQLLQKKFTSKRLWFGTVPGFVAERMGWNNTFPFGDVLYCWPFNFLLKKALKMERDYDYLKILRQVSMFA